MRRLTDGVEAEIRRAESSGEHVPFALPFDFQINTAGDTEVVEIPINGDIGEQRAIDALNLLREQIVPGVGGTARLRSDKIRAFSVSDRR